MPWAVPRPAPNWTDTGVDRRNYYRLLHVQPDAPDAVIKAAYRALMALHHPDRGGSAATAALLNEAWVVLGHPAARRAYDAKRAARVDAMRARAAAVQAVDQLASRRHGGSASAPLTPRAAPDRHDDLACPFCTRGTRRGLRCRHCRAPLAAVSAPAPRRSAGSEERRRLPRVSRADWVRLYRTPQGPGLSVRLRNLSFAGVGFFVGVALPPGQRMRLIGEAFDVVIDVLSCQAEGAVFGIRARIVTALFGP